MYNASLTSVLAVHKTQLPYNNYQELYLKSDHKVVTVAGTSYITLLKTGNAIEQKIHSERLLIVSSVEEGLEKVSEGNSAFLWTIPPVSLLVGQNCTHLQLPECVYTSLVEGWAVRKDFAYTGFFNY